MTNKRFTDYLAECLDEKKYAFKIKVAGDLPDHFNDALNAALQKYEILSFAKGKTTPIQSKCVEFPELENVSYTMFDTELRYPTTSTVLLSYISEQTGVTIDRIRVRSLKEEEELEINAEQKPNDKPLLNRPLEKENNQATVGDKGISNFLKDLAKARKDTGLTQYKGVNDSMLAKSSPKEKETATIANAKSATSPLSSVSNPNPRTGK